MAKEAGFTAMTGPKAAGVHPGNWYWDAGLCIYGQSPF